MGRLIDGNWVKSDVITSDKNGAYDRIARSFLDDISDKSKFTPEKDRYHLYVSYACPWAHRTLIYRKLKGLEDFIGVSVVHPDMLDMGWSFAKDFIDTTGDQLYNLDYLYKLYQMASNKVSTSVTVPVLWDKKLKTIVNNESSEIIRIFNNAFNSLSGNHEDFYPLALREEIDNWNDLIYDNINNGVYKTGFAKNQEVYTDACTKLFEALEVIEKHLENKKFLVGEQLTEADLRLIPTLLRFDIVYVTHFKCNIKRIKDFKNLSRYTRDLYELSAIKSTTNFEHIKRHYYYSHESINPFRIVALGPGQII